MSNVATAAEARPVSMVTTMIRVRSASVRWKPVLDFRRKYTMHPAMMISHTAVPASQTYKSKR